MAYDLDALAAWDDAWHEWRRGGIGASDIPAISGLSPWATPLSVYLRKRGELPEEPENDAMRWGKLLEPIITAEFERANPGLYVVGAQSWCEHPELTWARCTVDGFVAESPNSTRGDALGTFQAKSTGDRARFDPVPDYVVLQCQWEMFVTDCERCWLGIGGGGVRGGMGYETRELARDDAAIERLVKTAQAFWHDVQEGNPPEPVAGDAADLAAAYADSDPSASVELGDEGAQLVEEIRALKAAGKVNADRLAAAENTLKARLGEAESGLIGGEVAVTWRASDRRTIDVQALRADLPDVANRYTRTDTSRRFLVK